MKVGKGRHQDPAFQPLVAVGCRGSRLDRDDAPVVAQRHADVLGPSIGKERTRGEKYGHGVHFDWTKKHFDYTK